MRIGCGQRIGQAMTKKDIVAQHHRRRGTIQKILSQNIGLRQSIRAGLGDVGQ
jgi:hypothetical protein